MFMVVFGQCGVLFGGFVVGFGDVRVVGCFVVLVMFSVLGL